MVSSGSAGSALAAASYADGCGRCAASRLRSAMLALSGPSLSLWQGRRKVPGSLRSMSSTMGSQFAGHF